MNGGFVVNDGNSGGNYAVTTPTASGSITAAPLTIVAASASMTYDATTTSSAAPTVAGLQGADTVTGLAESYHSCNAGSRTLSVNGGFVVNDGNNGENYNVATSNAPRNITPGATGDRGGGG